jgi:hypothetical protein
MGKMLIWSIMEYQSGSSHLGEGTAKKPSFLPQSLLRWARALQASDMMA